jgi:multiple sugar transport system substrate-binding protein
MKALQWLFRSLIVILIVGIVAACGNTTAPSAGSGDKPKANESEAVSLEFWVYSETDPVLKLIEEWNKKNPNIQVKPVEVTGSPNEYFQKVSTAFASGKGPDIFHMSPTEFTKYVDSGIAYPVNEWLDPNIADYYDNPIKANTVEGQIYAFPANMDLLALYYDKKLFEKEGIEPPTTWDETIQIAKKLATDKRYGMLIETNEGGYQNFEFYPFIWMTGNRIIAEDGKTVVVNNDGTKQALQFYRDLVNSGAVSKKLETGGWDIGPLAEGRTAMMLSGSWNVRGLREDHPDFEFGVVPYPVPEAGMTSSSDAGGWRIMLSSKGKNPKLAGQMVDWMTNQDPAQPLSIVTSEFKWSPRKSVIEAAGDFYGKYPMDVFTEQILPIAGMEPTLKAGVVKAVGQAIQEAMFTDKSMDQIVEELEGKSLKAMQEE